MRVYGHRNRRRMEGDAPRIQVNHREREIGRFALNRPKETLRFFIAEQSAELATDLRKIKAALRERALSPRVRLKSFFPGVMMFGDAAREIVIFSAFSRARDGWSRDLNRLIDTAATLRRQIGMNRK